MRALSAADAVSAAIQRTRDFLFRPFAWGTYLKLGLVAIITEGLGGNLNSNSSHGGQSSGHVPMMHSPFDLSAIQIAAMAAMLLLVLLFAMWIFYLVTRLRFAFFHCLVRNTTQIRPDTSNFLGVHVLKRSKLLVKRETSLEVVWPSTTAAVVTTAVAQPVAASTVQ